MAETLLKSQIYNFTLMNYVLNKYNNITYVSELSSFFTFSSFKLSLTLTVNLM